MTSRHSAVQESSHRNQWHDVADCGYDPYRFSQQTALSERSFPSIKTASWQSADNKVPSFLEKPPTSIRTEMGRALADQLGRFSNEARGTFATKLGCLIVPSKNGRPNWRSAALLQVPRRSIEEARMVLRDSEDPSADALRGGLVAGGSLVDDIGTHPPYTLPGLFAFQITPPSDARPGADTFAYDVPHYQPLDVPITPNTPARASLETPNEPKRAPLQERTNGHYTPVSDLAARRRLGHGHRRKPALALAPLTPQTAYTLFAKRRLAELPPPPHTPCISISHTSILSHPLVAYKDGDTLIHWDMRNPPSYLRIPPLVQPTELVTAATTSNARYIRLTSPLMPWSIPIEHPSTVSVMHVFEAVYAELQKPVRDSDWTIASESHRERVVEAYNERCAAYENPEPERSLGIKRIDWLVKNTRFGGLRKDEGATVLRDSLTPYTFTLVCQPR